jgi:hypothetical protein
MSTIKVLKFAIAVIFSIIGLVGVYLMFQAELQTGQNHGYYFKWALGAGLVFLAIGAALTAFDKNDKVVTDYTDASQVK